MATLVGIFKRSEYKKLLPLFVQNTDTCDTDTETLAPLTDQDYIALFRLGNTRNYECEGVRALGMWFLGGNDTLLKSRAVVDDSDRTAVLITAGIQVPTTNNDRFKHVTVRRRRRPSR